MIELPCHLFNIIPPTKPPYETLSAVATAVLRVHADISIHPWVVITGSSSKDHTAAFLRAFSIDLRRMPERLVIASIHKREGY